LFFFFGLFFLKILLSCRSFHFFLSFSRGGVFLSKIEGTRGGFERNFLSLSRREEDFKEEEEGFHYS
jgi:hypothetical protein